MYRVNFTNMVNSFFPELCPPYTCENRCYQPLYTIVEARTLVNAIYLSVSSFLNSQITESYVINW